MYSRCSSNRDSNYRDLLYQQLYVVQIGADRVGRFLCTKQVSIAERRVFSLSFQNAGFCNHKSASIDAHVLQGMKALYNVPVSIVTNAISW